MFFGPGYCRWVSSRDTALKYGEAPLAPLTSWFGGLALQRYPLCVDTEMKSNLSQSDKH